MGTEPNWVPDDFLPDDPAKRAAIWRERARALEAERDALREALERIADFRWDGFTRVEHAGDIGQREEHPKNIARAALSSTQDAE